MLILVVPFILISVSIQGMEYSGSSKVNYNIAAAVLAASAMGYVIFLLAFDLIFGVYKFLKEKSYLGLLVAALLLSVILMIKSLDYGRSVPYESCQSTSSSLACSEGFTRSYAGWPAPIFQKSPDVAAWEWTPNYTGAALNFGFWLAISTGALVGARLMYNKLKK